MDITPARSQTRIDHIDVYAAQLLRVENYGPPPCTMIERAGDPVNLGPDRIVDGYPHRPRDQHWITIHTNAFSGNVLIQGSLKTNPNGDDWFPVLDKAFHDTAGKNMAVEMLKGRFTMMRAWVFADRGMVDRIILA